MSKRGNNEGSIYKRSDGRWAATISVGWQDGKRARKTFYGKKRSEVQLKLNKALNQKGLGISVQSDKLRVEAFLNDWLEESAKPSVRPRTYQSYAEIVRLHLVPGVGRLALSRLSPQDVQKLINRKLADGLSPRRVQYIHAVLRRAIGQAEKWGLVDRNVAKVVSGPKVQQPEIDPFSPDEARAFIRAIEGDRLEALFTIAIATGLRQSEVLGLYWNDITFDRAEMNVRRSLQRIDGQFHFLELKTTRSRRTLALPPIAIDALKRHRSRQLVEKLIAGGDWKDTGLVFTTRLGEPLTDGAVRDRFYRILVNNGLRKQRFHDLRHSCASLMIAQGVQPRVIMETLGHSTIAMTMNRYAHVIQEVQREAAGKIGELLSG